MRAGAEADAGAERLPCEVCGHPLEARGTRERAVTVRGNRPVRLRRRSVVCPACGAGHFPLDRELELSASAFSPYLVEAVACTS
jgi:hypothetical protein